MNMHVGCSCGLWMTAVTGIIHGTAGFAIREPPVSTFGVTGTRGKQNGKATMDTGMSWVDLDTNEPVVKTKGIEYEFGRSLRAGPCDGAGLRLGQKPWIEEADAVFERVHAMEQDYDSDTNEPVVKTKGNEYELAKPDFPPVASRIRSPRTVASHL